MYSSIIQIFTNLYIFWSRSQSQITEALLYWVTVLYIKVPVQIQVHQQNFKSFCNSFSLVTL